MSFEQFTINHLSYLCKYSVEMIMFLSKLTIQLHSRLFVILICYEQMAYYFERSLSGYKTNVRI